MQIGFPIPNFEPVSTDACFCRSGKLFGDCCGSTAPGRRVPAGIQVFPGFVDAATCRKWVARLERLPRERGEVTDVNRSGGREAITHAAPGRVVDEIRLGVLRRQIGEAVHRGFALGARASGRALDWYEAPRVLRYEAGGFYHRHADSCQVIRSSNTWYKVRDRDLSLLLYLNEDFTGGGLTFVHFRLHYQPRVGDLLVFPSDNRYEHRAERVISGLRYAVVSWAAFRDGRRVFAAPPEGAVTVAG